MTHRERLVDLVCWVFPEHFNKETLGFWFWTQLGNIALCCIYYKDRQTDPGFGPAISEIEEGLRYLIEHKKFSDE